MLELIANGNILDVEDVSFNITLRSPLDDEPGGFIFTFTIPYTNQNAKAFGFPFQITGINSVTSHREGSIIDNGIVLKKGKWQATSTNGLTISIDMYIAAGSFYEFIDGKMLPELFDIELEYPDMMLHVKEHTLLSFPQVNHNYPTIYNPSFYGKDDQSVNPHFLGVLNDWEGEDLYVTPTNNNSISPQLYLGFILKRIFEFAGFTISGDFFTNEFFQHSMLYNNFALDKLVPTKFSGEMTNKYPIYDEHILIWDENIQDQGNHYNINTGDYFVDKEGNYQIDIFLIHKPEIIPITAEEALIEIYYNDIVIYSFQKPFAFGTQDDFQFIHTSVHEILQADIGSNFYCKFMYLDINGDPVECHILEGAVSIFNQNAEENNTFDNVINYKNHVPNESVKSFLKKVFSSVMILPFFDDKFKSVKLVFFDKYYSDTKQIACTDGINRNAIKIDYPKYQGLKYQWNFAGPDDNLKDNFINPLDFELSGTVMSYIELPRVNAIEGSIYLVQSLNCFYIWAIVDHDLITYDWIPYSDNHTDLIIDDGNFPITNDLPPILMRSVKTTRDEWDFFRNLPCVDAKGTSIAFGLQNDFPLRIMFYHGIIEDETYPFPIATTSMYSTDGFQILPHDWVWKDIHTSFLNLYSTWLKKRIRIEFYKEFSRSEFANFSFENKGNKDGALILFTEVFANVFAKKLQTVKFTGWTK